MASMTLPRVHCGRAPSPGWPAGGVLAECKIVVKAAFPRRCGALGSSKIRDRITLVSIWFLFRNGPYAEGVTFQSPGSPRSGAPWGLKGNVGIPRRGFTRYSYLCNTFGVKGLYSWQLPSVALRGYAAALTLGSDG
jgi:hypothetical protein